MPKFWERIAAEYQAGSAHLFLLHFNVHDLAHDEVYGYLPMSYYLMEQMNALGCELVIGYSPSQGVVWPNLNQWKSVQELLGLLPTSDVWEGEAAEMPPMGEFRPDGTFIPKQLGIAQLRASVGEVSADSEPILVSSDQLQRLEISPKQLQIESGKMFRFTATAFDRSGRPIGVQYAHWEVVGDIGSMTRDGVFLGTKAGKGRVRVRVIDKDISAESGEITVVPGKLARLKIETPSRRISTEQSHAYELVGEDAHGNTVRVQNARWEVLRPDEAAPQRSLINSKLIVEKIDEDPLIQKKLPPTDPELRKKLNDLLHQDGVRAGVVFNFMEKIAPNAEMTTLDKDAMILLETFQQWSMDFDMRLKKHIVLLVTQNLAEVHPALTKNSDIPVIEIPFPDYHERLEFIEHLMNLPVRGQAAERAQFTSRLTLASGLSTEQLARDTAGLNLFGLHDVALRAEEVREPITRELVENYRRESVKIFSRGLLEVSSPSAGDLDSMFGLDHVINIIRDIIDALNEGDLQRVPHGMLFLGSPGTGKVMAAKLLAGHGNMAFVQMKHAQEGLGIEYSALGYEERIFERNMTFAINFIRALAPAVVFIEGVDQGTLRADPLPDRPNSMFPVELLNAINDASLQGRVIWIGASQRPDLIDPLFRRGGIFDYKLIFLAPTAVDRAKILDAFCKGSGINTQGIDFERLTADEYAHGFTARDFSVIVRRSYTIAKRNRRQSVTEADLVEAIADYMLDYSPEFNLFIGLLALREANSRAMIPPTLPPEYQEFIEGNRINKTAINRRLLELGEQLGLVG
jgi:transitional endoplasmic reticulum ATPase